MKLFHQYMAIFINLSPSSNHFQPLKVENCDSNSRLVVDEMTMVNSGLKGLNDLNFNPRKKEFFCTPLGDNNCYHGYWK